MSFFQSGAWGAALIVFREVFEIAIILSVVLAATTSLKHTRGKWIWIGLVTGTLGAGLFALITQAVVVYLGDAGKQYFNAAILMAAVAMIGWTVIWMRQHGKTISQNFKKIGKDISEGKKPLYILATIISLAVMREGSEIVIFLYGLSAAGQATWRDIFVGMIVGLTMGITFGLLMYQGLLRISIKYTFRILSILLTFIAAGMAANAAGKFVKAGMLPTLVNSLWNTADWLPQHSTIGRFLFILIGYQENPNGMQALFYFFTLLTIFTMTKMQGKNIR